MYPFGVGEHTIRSCAEKPGRQICEVERCEQSWPARPEHVGAARRAASVAAQRAGAERDVLDAVRLAVSEAVSNVVVHGYRHAGRGDFTVSVQWGDDQLEVTVRDHGCGMQPRMDSPGAGLGLPLIASLAKSFSVSEPPDGGTEVRMTFPLRILEAA
jgi:anti-sigma regulatory factor (Ser/Thr protein kinase)